MRIGPLRSYAPSIGRKLLLGAVSSFAFYSIFPGAALAIDFTQSKYRMGAMGPEVTNPALLPGWSFTRSSTGYAEGLINDMTVNYVSKSQELDNGSKWNALTATVTGDAGVAPDGTMTADRLTTTAQSQPRIEQLASSFPTGLNTASAFVKYETARYFFFGAYDGSVDHYAVFDLLTGTVVGTIGTQFSNLSIIPADNGYVRVVANWTKGVIASGFKIVISNQSVPASVATAGLSTLVWGIQVEPKSTVSNYIPTNLVPAVGPSGRGQVSGLVSFGANVPRITNKGLLIEEARTNLLLRSTNLGNATVWRTNGTTVGGTGSVPTVTSNAGIAPDGTLTATRLQMALNGGTTVSDRSGINQGVTVADATAHTGTLWVKSNTGANYNIACYVQTNGSTLPIVHTVTPQWTRIATTGTSNGTVATFRILLQGSFGVSNAADILVWGAQLEVGSFATSHIPTEAAAATRAADSTTISGLGVILGQFRTNKVTINNANPISTAGLAKAGDPAAVLSLVDDAAALEAGGLLGVVTAGKVFELNNSAGTSTATVTVPGSTGNTNAHSISVYARVLSGGNGRLEMSGVIGRIAINGTSYVRWVSPNVVPTDAARNLVVSAEAGQTVRFILPQLEEGSFVTSPIVTQGAPATVGNPFTFYVSADMAQAMSLQRLLSVDSSLANRSVISRDTTGRIEFYQSANGAIQTSTYVTGFGADANVRACMRVRANGYRPAVNGLLQPEITATPPNGLSSLTLGVSPYGTPGFLNGYLQRVVIFGDVDDTTLQTLTT